MAAAAPQTNPRQRSQTDNPIQSTSTLNNHSRQMSLPTHVRKTYNGGAATGRQPGNKQPSEDHSLYQRKEDLVGENKERNKDLKRKASPLQTGTHQNNHPHPHRQVGPHATQAHRKGRKRGKKHPQRGGADACAEETSMSTGHSYKAAGQAKERRPTEQRQKEEQMASQALPLAGLKALEYTYDCMQAGEQNQEIKSCRASQQLARKTTILFHWKQCLHHAN